jgi:excisionase family DNA binding protein
VHVEFRKTGSGFISVVIVRAGLRGSHTPPSTLPDSGPQRHSQYRSRPSRTFYLGPGNSLSFREKAIHGGAVQSAPMEHLLRPSETADILGIKVSTLYTWVARREIPFQKVGRALRFAPSALTKWLARQAWVDEDENDSDR